MRIYVYLAGGIGNKLFQLSYACTNSISKKDVIFVLEDEPTEDIDYLIRLINSSGIKIKRLQSRITAVAIRGLSSICLRLAGMHSKKNRFSRCLYSIIKIFEVIYKIVRGRGLSLKIDYQRHNESGKDSLLIGYFQTYRSLDSRLINLINNNLEFGNRQPKACAIHIRRGDYLLNPQIGTLSDLYFINAARSLHDNYQINEFELYSDAPGDLGGIISEVEKFSKVRIAEPQRTALQTLMKLGTFNFLIMSNSSFSWWSANIGSQTKMVLCPSQWFTKIPEPSKLKLEKWQILDSRWAG